MTTNLTAFFSPAHTLRQKPLTQRSERKSPPAGSSFSHLATPTDSARDVAQTGATQVRDLACCLLLAVGKTGRFWGLMLAAGGAYEKSQVACLRRGSGIYSIFFSVSLYSYGDDIWYDIMMIWYSRIHTMMMLWWWWCVWCAVLVWQHVVVCGLQAYCVIVPRIMLYAITFFVFVSVSRFLNLFLFCWCFLRRCVL